MRNLEIRPLRPEDDPSSLSLHRRAFEPRWSGGTWAWRFRGCPGSACAMVGAFTPEGRCLAMFGGLRLPFLLEGERCHAINNGDSAVDPEVRRGLAGPRLLRAVGEAFYELHGDGSTALVFGFPKPGLRRACLRFRFGEHLSDVLFLVHDLQRRVTAPSGVLVREVAAFGSETDALWERCARELRAAVVRDAAYLNHRYRDHPAVDYALLEARDARTGELRGVGALREGGWDPSVASLVEWLAPLDDDEADAALAAHACRWAVARRRAKLVSWMPAICPRVRRLQVRHGFYLYPTPYVELFRSYRNGLDRQWLHDNFYQTMGDIDFC